MERILYLNETFCAVAEDGRLVEYIPAAAGDETGQILRGKIERMMPGLEAAFVDIGRKKAGFLPLKENSRSFTGGAIRSGDRVWVQIRKEETGEKGAYLSRDLTIAGSRILLMPMNRHIGVSARITDEETRQRLAETGRRLADGQCGIVPLVGFKSPESRLSVVDLPQPEGPKSAINCPSPISKSKLLTAITSSFCFLPLAGNTFVRFFNVTFIMPFSFRKVILKRYIDPLYTFFLHFSRCVTHQFSSAIFDAT